LARRVRLQGVKERRFRQTIRPGAPERLAPGLVHRHFAADRPNALQLADITYVSTDEGSQHAAAMLDLLTYLVARRAMDRRPERELPLLAARMTYAESHPRDVIRHSDHRTEYTALAPGKRCACF